MKKLSTILISAGLFAVTQSANAALVQLPSDPGFGTVIGFDSIADDVDIFDQYVAQGVKFRDALSTFANASTNPATSPGDTTNEEFRSPQNSLEAEDVFILFENPVFEVGGYVRNENVADNITLTAYGTDLSTLGTVTIAPGAMFLFLGGTDNTAIAAISYTGDDFYLDDIGFNVVPVPAAVWLFGSGLLGLIGIARRKKAV